MIKKCVKCGKEFDAKRKDRKYCDECSKNRHSPVEKENKIHVVYKGKYSRKQFWVNPVWDYHHNKVNREITQKIIYLYTKKDWYGMGTVYGFDAVDTDSELRFTETHEETNHFEREISFVPSVEHRLSKEYVHTTLKEKPTLIGEHLYEITIQHERILYCLEDGDNEKLKQYLIDRPGIICVDIEPLISEVNVKSKINKDNRTEKLKSKPKKIKKNIRIFKSNNYPEKVNWDLVQFDWNKKPDVVLNLNDGYYTGWVPDVDFIIIECVLVIERLRKRIFINGRIMIPVR
jgi:predicted  nucleic acid-binding Zn-ribbon protein